VTGTVRTSWNLDPAVVAGLAVAAWAYGRGVRALWRGGRRRGVSSWRVAAFAGGLLALVVALVSPLDALAAELLWAHMVQHVVLVLVAAPLLVLGAAPIPMMLAVHGPWRRRIRAWGRVGWIRAPGHLMARPVTAWFLHVAVLWLWHAPALYDTAVNSELIHAVEHLSFLGTALLFWWVAFPQGARRHLSGGSDVLYVFTGGIQSGALGALLTFAGTPLYLAYAHTTARWGLTPIQDQQLAGLIMWIPAGVVYVVAAGVLFVRWLLTIEREARKAEGRSGSLGLLGERP
jgi:putative membrane protein